jgi:hypothetical protein
MTMTMKMTMTMTMTITTIQDHHTKIENIWHLSPNSFLIPDRG